jgi:hypothetical protein
MSTSYLEKLIGDAPPVDRSECSGALGIRRERRKLKEVPDAVPAPTGPAMTRTVPAALAAHLAESSCQASATLASLASQLGIENPRVRVKSSSVAPPIDRAIFAASSQEPYQRGSWAWTPHDR